MWRSLTLVTSAPDCVFRKGYCDKWTHSFDTFENDPLQIIGLWKKWIKIHYENMHETILSLDNINWTAKIPQKVLDRPINIDQFGNINNYKIWELAEIELKTAILGDFLATFGLFICVTDPLGMVCNRFHSLKMWNECGSFVSIVSELCWSIWGIKNTWATIKTILLTFNGFDEWEKLI